jgi:hypothetical protein
MNNFMHVEVSHLNQSPYYPNKAAWNSN